MTRPAPRKSSLAGSTPITPPEEPAAPKVSHEPVAAPASPPEEERPSGVVEPPAKPKAAAPKWRPKVSFYQDEEDTKRMRGAFIHTQGVEGSRSLSQFIHNAVMAETIRLEEKYNDGQPFPQVVAKEMPQGRPLNQ